MFMFERKFGGDFPRATQPGKLRKAGLEITFAGLSLGIMLGSLALTTDRQKRPQAP